MYFLEVWCKGDEDLYDYVQTWFATIISHPLAKTCIALVVKGEGEGTGKNTVTDAWCELLAGYSNPNADIDSIVGNYNPGMFNVKLSCCNELDSIDISTKTVNGNLKKAITEQYSDLKMKYMNTVPNVQQALNLVLLSNEWNPVAMGSKDRRYCVLTPSEKYRNDDKYFDPLYATMKQNPKDHHSSYRKDFMNALMYFYMNYPIKRSLKKIPLTEEKILAQSTNKGAVESFMEEYVVELSEDGIGRNECYDWFKAFVTETARVLEHTDLMLRLKLIMRSFINRRWKNANQKHLNKNVNVWRK